MDRARAAHRAWRVARFTFSAVRVVGWIAVGAAQNEIEWRRSRSALDAEPGGVAGWWATVLGEMADFGPRENAQDAGQSSAHSCR